MAKPTTQPTPAELPVLPTRVEAPDNATGGLAEILAAVHTHGIIPVEADEVLDMGTAAFQAMGDPERLACVQLAERITHAFVGAVCDGLAKNGQYIASANPAPIAPATGEQG
jgi:hypothetical protein